MQSTSPIVGGRNVCPSRKYFEESTYVGDNEGEVESCWKCTFCNFFMRGQYMAARARMHLAGEKLLALERLTFARKLMTK